MTRDSHERGERFVILFYHRVTTSETADFIPSSVSCPLPRFASHLAVLRDHFSILPLEPAWQAVSEGRDLPPRTVVLTFDDCWYENVETVAGPLEKASIPATFFLPVGDVDREDLHPDHQFFYLFKQVGVQQLKEVLSSMLPLTAVPPEQEITPSRLRLWLQAALGYELTSSAGRSFLKGLEERVDVPSSAGLGRTLYMTSEQVRSLSAHGIAVGNHTVNHRNLATLPDEDQHAEILAGRQQLSALSRQPVRTLAYPYGLFSEGSPTIAASTGHCCACTTVKGYNDKHTDRWRLTRIDATQFSDEKLFNTITEYGKAV